MVTNVTGSVALTPKSRLASSFDAPSEARRPTATTAATVQLSVPVLAAIGGVVLLREPLTVRLTLAAMAILGGVAMVVLTPGRRQDGE